MQDNGGERLRYPRSPEPQACGRCSLMLPSDMFATDPRRRTGLNTWCRQAPVTCPQLASPSQREKAIFPAGADCLSGLGFRVHFSSAGLAHPRRRRNERRRPAASTKPLRPPGSGSLTPRGPATSATRCGNLSKSPSDRDANRRCVPRYAGPMLTSKDLEQPAHLSAETVPTSSSISSALCILADRFFWVCSRRSQSQSSAAIQEPRTASRTCASSAHRKPRGSGGQSCWMANPSCKQRASGAPSAGR